MSQGDNGKPWVRNFGSRSLWQPEKSMRNYSSAYLEVLVLKCAITGNFMITCLGQSHVVCMDSNPLAYVWKSKLGTSQIQCLSELNLSDLTIKYRTGKSIFISM